MRALPAPWILLLIASCTGTERTRDAKADPSRESERGLAAHIVDLSLSEGRAYELLRELVTQAPHRLSGSDGAARAVTWAQATMQRLGLANVRLHRCMVPRWERGAPEQVRVLKPAPAHDLACLALGGSVGTPAAGVEGEIVVVRTSSQLEALGTAVRGKIVLFNRPMPRALRNTFAAYGASVPQRVSGASRAAKHGAIAALVRSMTTRIDDVPHTGGMRYAPDVPKIPALAVSTMAAEELAKMAKAGPTWVRVRASCRMLADVESSNVIGEIVGSEKPDEVVVIGGHLDCWDVGQGAHDDGSGSIECLEAARLLIAAGLRPKRTIRVVFFMNEENGLRGALAYAKDHANHKHVAAIESDRGGFEPKGFTSSARGDAFARYKAIVDDLRPFGMGVLIPGGGGADIGPLGLQGVPLFGLLPAWNRYFDYHHSKRDTIDAVHPRELALGAAAIAYLALRLANE
jgi:Zn-dependent M28 family amino/carboxypeptidase